jgi:ubiquinone/menaquinone biosynthesis C-methylase UbiE
MTQDEHASDQRTVEYFDSIAEDYDGLYDEKTPGGYSFALRRHRVLELFDKPGGNVLDVGCGSGVMVEGLLERNCTFWGVDPSSEMIDQCRKSFGSHPKTYFSVGAAEEISFPDDSFDAVICMGVIERVENQAAGLRELVRVLKKDGTLIITLPNKMSPHLLWRDFVFYPVVSVLRPLYYTLSGKARRPVIPGHRLFSATSYADAVAQNGCLVTDIVYSGFNVLLPPLDSFFPGLAVSAMVKLEALHQGRFRHLAGCIIVKARKR